ncbi:hypothetical protein [Alkalimarinus sediminis]|uniref:Lipoprotein n=1 Tax=Alkalimarinus sediminis TaxID=1632866 RepID=A0A9E8HNR4_9ALTE|nr:hypothetical protein [Alkalimarinus sediminis]UZW75978.1 hypothetical protein NNL22_05185 [Alkalimarinus sediminis]
MATTIIKFIVLGCIVTFLSGCATGVGVDQSLNTEEINNQIASLAKMGQEGNQSPTTVKEPVKLTLTDMSAPITAKQTFVLNTFLMQQNKQFSYATINLSLASNDYGSVATALTNAREVAKQLDRDGVESEIMFNPDGIPGQLVVVMEASAPHAK